MFGTFLRLERNRVRLDSGFVAMQLGLTETYYRLIESGRAALNQSLVFRLISLLESHRGSSGDSPAHIHFERLALYLVGSQWVGAEMTAHPKVKDADRLAVETLASHSSDFQEFHLRTQRYYDLREGEETQRRFLEETATEVVGDFLGRFDFACPSTEGIVQGVMPAEELLALPTLSVEMITRLLEDLKDRPFVHTSKVASNWENRTSRRIHKVHGLFRSVDLIVNTENLKFFHYNYLREKHFGQLRFVFLQPGNAAAQKSMFVRKLNAARKAANLVLIDDSETERISFVMLGRDRDQQLRGQAEEFLKRKGSDRKYNAYWSFDTGSAIRWSNIKEMPIGFVGHSDAGAEDVWNLSLAESVDKKRAFDAFWYAITQSQG